jgi:hypothetical protein
MTMSSFLSSLLSIFRSNNLPQQLQDLGIRTMQDAASIQLQNRAGQQIALNETSVIIQDTNGNVVTLDAAGIHIQSSAAIRLDCSQLSLTAGQISLNAGMVKATGVIQCDTIIANSVVGSSYTPGSGNVW